VYVVSCRKSPFNIFILFQSRLLKFICKWLTLNRDTYKAKQCRTWSVKVPCRPVLSRHLTDCETAPINPRGNTKPLYINGVQRYFCSLPPPPFPPEQSHAYSAYSPLKYFMLTLSTLTLFVRDLCLSTVAPYSSAWQRRRARSSVFSLPYRRVTGSCSRPVYPASPSHYVQTARVSSYLCRRERSVWTGLVSGCPTRISRYSDISPACRCVLLIISSQVKERRTTYVHCLFFSFAARIFGAKNFYFPWKNIPYRRVSLHSPTMSKTQRIAQWGFFVEFFIIFQDFYIIL